MNRPRLQRGPTIEEAVQTVTTNAAVEKTFQTWAHDMAKALRHRGVRRILPPRDAMAEPIAFLDPQNNERRDRDRVGLSWWRPFEWCDSGDPVTLSGGRRGGGAHS